MAIATDTRRTATRHTTTTAPHGLARVIGDLLGTDGHDLPIRIDCYDGGGLGPRDAATALVVRSPEALRYILTSPGELGFASSLKIAAATGRWFKSGVSARMESQVASTGSACAAGR